MNSYTVRKLHRTSISVTVPASKSILNRALILAAFTEGDIFLECGPFGDDARAMLSCLAELGICFEQRDGGLLMHGVAEIPVKSAVLHVGSAGTVARFLTATLAYHGGDYEMHASEQMTSRPMELLPALEKAGVEFEYLGERYHFPFRMHSEGITQNSVTVEANSSTQYASGLLLAAATGKREFSVKLAEGFSRQSYISLTIDVIHAFGGSCDRTDGEFLVSPICNKPDAYRVDPDVSAACYFLATSLLLGNEVLVRGLSRTRNGRQIHWGDYGFIDLLEGAGVCFEETEEGLRAFINRTDDRGYEGFDINVEEFSDQTLTIAALAPFATTPTHIRGFAHIRRQECDRVRAILENLSRLNVPCSATENEIVIYPAPIQPNTIRTFGDHRVAMGFALVGLKTGNITIEDPLCCKKTFESYFDILDELTT